MKLIPLTQRIYLIEDFWTKAQCDDFIVRSEQIGFEPATVETEAGHRIVEAARTNDRVIHHDKVLADTLWASLEPYAPAQIGNSKACGLNEQFRFYKYKAGQRFKKHRDQSFIRNESEASYYTFMIYLNDDYSGGETQFEDTVIKPRRGTALIFLHALEHEGSEIREGTKYVLRTDIMYQLCD